MCSSSLYLDFPVTALGMVGSTCSSQELVREQRLDSFRFFTSPSQTSPTFSAQVPCSLLPLQSSCCCTVPSHLAPEGMCVWGVGAQFTHLAALAVESSAHVVFDPELLPVLLFLNHIIAFLFSKLQYYFVLGIQLLFSILGEPTHLFL